MKIKDLTHQLTIEEPWLFSDSGGGFTQSWQSIAQDSTVFAAIRQSSGTRSNSAHKEEFDASYIITLRYRDDMRPDYRLRAEDAVYTITAIDDTDATKTWLTLRATHRFF